MPPAGVGPPGFLKLTVDKDENKTVTLMLTVYTVILVQLITLDV